jgi:hypothetical protein
VRPAVAAPPLRRALTSPVVPFALLAAAALVLLACKQDTPALLAAAAVAGVALSGST